MENTVCRPICRAAFTLSSRTTAFLFLLAVVCCCFSLPASANSPPPPSFFYGEIVNAPAEAVYADILVPPDTSDSHYVAFNSENRTGISASTPPSCNTRKTATAVSSAITTA